MFNENLHDRKLTILSKNNDIFHYDIYLDQDNVVTDVDNQWHISNLPVYINHKIDMVSLKHYIQNKRPEFYISDDSKILNETFINDSVPLENLVKLKDKVDNIISNIESCERIIIKEIDNDNNDDYTNGVWDLNSYANSIINDNYLDNLNIELSDLLNKL